MVKEDIYCGMIWDSELNKFIGLFTIRDFLNLIKVLYEKINILMGKNKQTIYNTNNLVSYLFPSNKIDLDRLDEIMEDPESAKYSETKSEKSDFNDIIVEEELNTNENTQLNYKELFKIFKHININDYFTDIHQVSLYIILGSLLKFKFNFSFLGRRFEEMCRFA
jgi:hypothetical protein